MASVKKFCKKRVCFAIIIVIFISLITSFVVTKTVYDYTFRRFECGNTDYHPDLADTVKGRQEVSYLSGENRLQGYLYRSGAEGHDALIVLVPGYNACADMYLWQIKDLVDRGWSVFAFDATGCCSSEGDSCKGFPQELPDLQATLNHIEKENRFGYNDIVLLGHSRGGYAACCVLQYGYDIQAVVSVSGVNSAMAGVIGGAEHYVGPLAYGNYGFLWLYQVMLFGSETVNLRADQVLACADTPALLIHGENDTTVPYDKHAIIAYKANIQNAQSILWTDPENSGHTDILFDENGRANKALMDRIDAFLNNTER